MRPIKAAHYGESVQEKEFYAQKRLDYWVPGYTLYDNQLAMGRQILSSEVFAAARGERKFVKVEIATYGLHTRRVRYEGEQLRQDDARVLSFLLHEVRNRPVDGVIDIKPYEFVKHIGWSASGANVDKLKACIKRMQRGLLEVEIKGSFVSAQLVRDFEGNAKEWSVRLHPNIVHLFADCRPTFFSKEGRMKLEDGLQSWLAGFLKANNDERVFDLSELRERSGWNGTDAREFTKSMKSAMEKVQAAGFVGSYEFTYGRMKVVKA